jgi:hypothetical protein
VLEEIQATLGVEVGIVACGEGQMQKNLFADTTTAFFESAVGEIVNFVAERSRTLFGYSMIFLIDVDKLATFTSSDVIDSIRRLTVAVAI